MRRAFREKGFTLLELLIAIAVIAILVTVSRVGYRNMLTKSRRTEAKANLATVQRLMYTYASDSRRGFEVDDIGERWGNGNCSNRPAWVSQIGFDLGLCSDSNYSYSIESATQSEFFATASSGETGRNRICSWIAAGAASPATADRFSINHEGDLVHEQDCKSAK